jgi:hypothetical protein
LILMVTFKSTLLRGSFIRLINLETISTSSSTSPFLLKVVRIFFFCVDLISSSFFCFAMCECVRLYRCNLKVVVFFRFTGDCV